MTTPNSKAWIGVDLDGTLAYYDGWKGIDHIGKPIPEMWDRVKDWQKKGYRVKIFSARAALNDRSPEEQQQAIEHIQDWCETYGLGRLEVTCCKDFHMIEIWDDRAQRVELNTGRAL